MRFVTRAHPKPNQEKLLPPSSGMKRKRRLQVQAAGQGVPLHGTPPADRPGARAEGQLWGPDAEERAVQVEPAGEPDGAGRQVTGVRKSQVCASHRCAPSHRCAQVVRLCHLHGKAWVCIWVHGCACACISVCVSHALCPLLLMCSKAWRFRALDAWSLYSWSSLIFVLACFLSVFLTKRELQQGSLPGSQLAWVLGHSALATLLE